jgi:hypothetical protein
MIKKLTLYTIVLIISLNSFSQRKNYFTEIIEEYEVRAIESLYFNTTSQKLIANYLELNIDEFDINSYSQKIYSFQDESELQKFIEYIGKATVEYSRDDKNEIYNHIEVWCSLSEALQLPYIFEIESLSESHEIIANLPETEHLIDRYISVEGQYWGSLSSSQTSEVYYDVMQYLMNLDTKGKLKFLKDYFALAYEIETAP